MFKDILRVEIELFSYCNRKCNWCPNKELDRTFYEEMDEEVYLKIVDNLAYNNFGYMEDKFDKKMVTFNRFCEPTYNIDLIKKRCEQMLKKIPTVEFRFNTNGDFLSDELFEKLRLERLYIMDYDCKGKEYGLELFKRYNILFIEEENNHLVGIHKHINKVVFEYDWPKNTYLEDRGGFFKEDIYYKEDKVKWVNNREERTEGCFEPRNYISIDYNGNVTPCCHIRSDYGPHKKYIFGNVYEDELSNIFYSKKAKEFRRRIFTSDYENYPEPCKHCQKYRMLKERDRVMSKEDQKSIEGTNYEKNRERMKPEWYGTPDR
jgi:radical SAM protein with 4Fe4S-binding SPASM domain